MHPAWHSWVKLVELFTLCIQHTLQASDVQLIDRLQYEHSILFDKVSEYEGLKRPKHHFLAHAAQDVLRFGPPRGFWTLGFEGFNKVIKAGAKRSNYKNETLSIMKYWIMRSAHDMTRPADVCTL